MLPALGFKSHLSLVAKSTVDRKIIQHMEWNKGEFIITDNRQDLDLELIHNFLQDSYWAKEIPKKIVEKSIENSLSLGLFHHDEHNRIRAYRD